jgi:NOL1/NOP2/fmu family ribosome biogenesis protein
MSLIAHPSAFPRVEINYESAVSYLRHEAVVLDASVSRGYVLLTYRNQPLGFVKNIGNRANNLYPVEWRIRSGYMPDVIPIVL